MSESCPKTSSEGRESRPHVEGDENGNACELVKNNCKRNCVKW